MGHSQLEKQKTHERIVTLAARRLREEGLEGIGVADLMKEAGLTVGGFYKHFASRDELVAEAVQAAVEEQRRQMQERGIDPADVPLADYAENYLSAFHRDHCGEGCAYAALTADIARSGETVRTIATEGMRKNIETMMGRMPQADAADARRNALIATCLMAGAVGLARATNDETLSDELLEAARSFMRELANGNGT